MPEPGSIRFASIADEIGLSPDGLDINGKLVIKQIGPFYLPLVMEEETSPDVVNRLSKISTLLRDGDTYSAIMAASTSNWPRLGIFKKSFAKANFNPFEARDYRGRWTSGGQQHSNANVAEIGYNGFLHDTVVDDLVNAFRKVGAKAETNVIVSGFPSVPAIPDIVVLPVGAKIPIVIEVKTGQNPPFTPNQQYVYPLLCIGGHVTSSDPRLPSLGLSADTPFPPLEVHVLSTAGPGQPLYPLDLCEFLGLKP